jgi:1,4-alpha-glucan branching enzyme
VTARSAGRAPDPLHSGVSAADLERLRLGEHHDPHALLGAHPAPPGARRGVVVRAFHPDALSVQVVCDERPAAEMTALGDGVFAAFLPDRSCPLQYRLRFEFASGAVWERDDPYRFLPTVGDLDLHLFADGTHRRLWEALGARVREVDSVHGTSFAVWAPEARGVAVVGDFCAWDGRLLPMRSLGSSGVWELFVPGAGEGALYKYEIHTQSRELRVKSDPMAGSMEHPPATASRVQRSHYTFSDERWLAQRARRDWSREPLAIYEVHLGSWLPCKGSDESHPRYRELAPRLAAHVKKLGFTHLELMPLAEHAFYASWGYQNTGYYAPTARYGNPDDLRSFVDLVHREGLGVLLDWVPAHFPRDDYALRRFDGSALYEHADPRRGEHPDWGTLIFNYGRSEVRSFLISNALYWLREFHFDGLRVDAVASMLYLDYSRREGEWVPNIYGGRENLEAIEFLRQFNDAVHAEVPGAITVAEESTAWSGVTRPTQWGGLGFDFKWNMGWMNDTLRYFARDPIYRKHHHDDLTFAMIYEYSERFINPLSHDEAVHGKRSLLEKMPGDLWRKFAQLRTLLLYQVTRPGKLLLFMGTELALHSEWHHDVGLDWALGRDPQRQGLTRLLQTLLHQYRELSCLWRCDPEPAGFQWIDGGDRENSVLSYARFDGTEHALVVLNLTPIPRPGYRVGAPAAGFYRELLCTDDSAFGGSGYATRQRVRTEAIPWHGRQQSLVLELPPLGGLVLVPGE